MMILGCHWHPPPQAEMQHRHGNCCVWKEGIGISSRPSAQSLWATFKQNASSPSKVACFVLEVRILPKMQALKESLFFQNG